VAKQKYYVVWVGRSTGIFDNWPEAQASVAGFAGAKHKSFTALAEAEAAFAEAPALAKPSKTSSADTKVTKNPVSLSKYSLDPAFDIHIFCDGGCDPNPGEAGSAVVVYQSGKLCEMFHGLYQVDGTNNTAELKALHRAMIIAEDKLACGLSVQILSDSIYSVNAMTTWGTSWKNTGRMDGRGKPLANRELIAEMFQLYLKMEKRIDVIHVKAHCGIEGNELADRLCTLAIQKKVTGFDIYEELAVNALLALGNR